MQEYSAMWKRMIFVWIFAVTGLAFAQQTHTSPTPSQSYHHPSGFSFQYPQGWTLQDVSFAEAQLVPNDQSTNQQGVTEAFFLWSVGVTAGAADPSRVATYFDSIVTRLAPFLKRTSEVLNKDERLFIEWSGKSDDGQEVQATAGILPGPTFAFGLVMIATKDRFAARQDVFQGMVRSFRVEDFTRDFKLIGRWVSPSSEAQSQPAEQGMEMEIRTDGTFSFNDRTAGTETPQLSGEWFAADGLLCFILPESVTLRFRYELTADRDAPRKLLLFHSSGGQQQLIEVKK